MSTKQLWVGTLILLTTLLISAPQVLPGIEQWVQWSLEVLLMLANIKPLYIL